MAVGISLSKPAFPRRPPDQEPGVYFEDDGYYWFLYPFFERLAAKTGQFIDPYGDAEFSGAQLVQLRKTVAEARASAKPRRTTLRVTVGWRPEPVVETIQKSVLLEMLDQLDEMIRIARREKRMIVCFGD